MAISDCVAVVDYFFSPLCIIRIRRSEAGAESGPTVLCVVSGHSCALDSAWIIFSGVAQVRAILLASSRHLLTLVKGFQSLGRRDGGQGSEKGYPSFALRVIFGAQLGVCRDG